MDEKLRKQAIDLFVAQYGISPQDKGFPIIDVSAKQTAFLFGVDESALCAYKKVDAINKFGERFFWVPALFVILMYAAGMMVDNHPEYISLGLTAIWIGIFALLGWGVFIVILYRKFRDAKSKSKDKVINLSFDGKTKHSV